MVDRDPSPQHQHDKPQQHAAVVRDVLAEARLAVDVEARQGLVAVELLNHDVRVPLKLR